MKRHIPFLGWLCLICVAIDAHVTLAVDDATSPQAGSFDSAGVKIAYVVAGKGEPVVLVHGLHSSAEMNWVLPGTFKQLAEHYRVIALDLRGHGRSDKPTEESAYGIPMVEDIVRLMDHLEIKRAHIVGYSLGGIVVMRFVVDHPDRVISANLGGMGWLREGGALQRFWERVPGGGDSRTPAACLHGIAKLAISEQQLKSVKVPMEILIGDHDPCQQMYVEPLQTVRKDWPVITINDAGHITCVAKVQYKQELAKWLDKNAANKH